VVGCTLPTGEGVKDGDSCIWGEHMRMKPKETTRRRILLQDVLAVGDVHPSLHGGERTRTFGQIGTAFARVLSSTGFTGCGNSALVVILSEAKNPSRLKTKDQEGFFAQNRRSE